MTEQSYSVQPSSLRAFAQELQTQLDGIAAPMNTLVKQSSTQPQFGGFAEAWMLGDCQQSAIQEMYDLLGQVKQALGFVENVTNTIASAYQNADQDVAASYGAPGGATAAGTGGATAAAPAGTTAPGPASTTAPAPASTTAPAPASTTAPAPVSTTVPASGTTTASGSVTQLPAS